MYGDIADQASRTEEMERDAQVRRQRAKASKRQLIPTGSCYYCNSGVPAGHLFCDSSCREDYEEEQAAKLRNHGPHGQPN